MKIIFAGTHELALPTLQALIDSPHQLCAVYTQPDRPSGRGQKLAESPIKTLAMAHHLPIYQPATLREEKEQQIIKSLQADVMVVMGYGLLLPKAVLAHPHYGCINPHVSLLPRWRGAAPVQRAILAGDQKTGVTIIQMDEGLDTGAILKQQQCALLPEDTSATVHDRLARMAAPLLLQTLEDLIANKLQPVPQENANATYAAKIDKAEAKIDWHKTAVEIDRCVRAFNPWPIAYTDYQGQLIRFWKVKVLNEATHAMPGTILQVAKHGIDIATGDGIVRLLELQLPGGKRLPVSDFLNARHTFFKVGAII